MNTVLSDDQAQLEAACERLLARAWPLESAKASLGPGGAGHSPDLWKTLAEAGWLALGFPSEVGGADGDLIDLGLACRAAGRHLVPSSLYSCLFAELLIFNVGTAEQKADLLPPLFAGQQLATVAYSEASAAEDTRLFRTTATRAQNTWIIEGAKAFVPSLDVADKLIVLAKVRDNSDRSGWGAFVIDAEEALPRARRQSALGGQHLFEVQFEKVMLPGTALLGGAEAVATTLEAFGHTVEQATALQCMEMVGGISRVLERTVEYVTMRHQHNRPIGSYQAVQHMLANVAIQLHGARIAALQLLDCKAKGRPAARETSIAKVAIGEAYTNATTTAHQVWGAMGFAREAGLYLWSERAKVTDAWFGTRPMHLHRVADRMGV